jgi:hypothetical protein
MDLLATVDFHRLWWGRLRLCGMGLVVQRSCGEGDSGLERAPCGNAREGADRGQKSGKNLSGGLIAGSKGNV